LVGCERATVRGASGFDPDRSLSQSVVIAIATTGCASAPFRGGRATVIHRAGRLQNGERSMDPELVDRIYERQ
jgi:hypothetical protein